MQATLQLKITLVDTQPAIIRRLIVSSETTFFELHHIIQIAMGWQNMHLFEFSVNDYVIGIPSEAFEGEALRDETIIDADSITVGEALTDVNDTAMYIYDFGDNWMHEIVVENINSNATDFAGPACLDGNLSCPPENCGGAIGFERLFDIIKDVQHPEHEQMLAWLDDYYTQDAFDIDDVNTTLQSLDIYINNWLNQEENEDDEDEDDN